MIILPAILESFRSLKDKSFKVTFDTQELTPEQLAGIAVNIDKFGYLAFKETPFKDKEREIIEQLEPDYNDTGKTPSQRLRAVLYRCWEQNSESYADFNLYYQFHLEKIITHYKNKLD